MKKIILVLGLLSTLFTTGAFAGFPVMSADFRPVDSDLRAFYVGYDVVISRDLPYPYNSYYTMSIYPKRVCKNAMNCPVIPLTPPSHLRVTDQYYGECNALMTIGRTPYVSPVKVAMLQDNATWACAHARPIAPMTVTFVNAARISEFYIGQRYQ